MILAKYALLGGKRELMRGGGIGTRQASCMRKYYEV